MEAFHAKHGKTVANYDTLLAAAATAKASAQADLDVLKATSFDCSADDPKGSADAFKANLQAVRESLKEYRTAVKNLIVAVKSAHRTSTQGDEL